MTPISAERLAELRYAVSKSIQWNKRHFILSPNEMQGIIEDLVEKQTQLRSVMRDDTPWPLQSVLVQLIRAAEHLMNDHNCDLQGHELLREALASGNEILLALVRPSAIRKLREEAGK